MAPSLLFREDDCKEVDDVDGVDGVDDGNDGDVLHIYHNVAKFIRTNIDDFDHSLK